jgi:hypothetical protein
MKKITLADGVGKMLRISKGGTYNNQPEAGTDSRNN